MLQLWAGLCCCLWCQQVDWRCWQQLELQLAVSLHCCLYCSAGGDSLPANLIFIRSCQHKLSSGWECRQSPGKRQRACSPHWRERSGAAST